MFNVFGIDTINKLLEKNYNRKKNVLKPNL